MPASITAPCRTVIFDDSRARCPPRAITLRRYFASHYASATPYFIFHVIDYYTSHFEITRVTLRRQMISAIIIRAAVHAFSSASKRAIRRDITPAAYAMLYAR